MAYQKAQIVEMLKTNDRAIVRGVLAIYDKQTADEQVAQETNHHNGIGFNGVDARIMSSFAERIKGWQPGGKFNWPLSPKQMGIAKKKIMKYAGQLTKIANNEI